MGNFLTSCKPVSFSRRTLHRGVSKYVGFIIRISLQRLSETSDPKKNSWRYAHRPPRKALFYFRHILINLKFSGQIFEEKKLSDTKFYDIPSNGGEIFPCGQTGINDEANSGFLQFCESALKCTQLCDTKSERNKPFGIVRRNF